MDQPQGHSERQWRVTLFYEDGPRDGEYEEPLLQRNPGSVARWPAIVDAQGRQWDYVVSAREIDPSTRTVLVRLRLQIVDEK